MKKIETRKEIKYKPSFFYLINLLNKIVLKNLLNLQVTWVFLESNICNTLFNTDVLKKYDVSSLKQVLFGDTTIRHEVHESLIQSLPNVSIIQVYGVYAHYNCCNQYLTIYLKSTILGLFQVFRKLA